MDGTYAEVYAGGAAVGLSLLYGEFARTIHINDIDPGVHAFWSVATGNATALCRLIEQAKFSLKEWERQREVQKAPKDHEPLAVAFSTFYLNRTNRSGIIMGGVIGGKDQTGTWKMDARFNKPDLVARIERIGRWRSRINVHNLDGLAFLKTIVPTLPRKSLVYLDPPYYVKGQEDLYRNQYGDKDHEQIAAVLKTRVHRPWVVSYDDVPAIRKLYVGHRPRKYGIAYSASKRYRGSEVAFFSTKMGVPRVVDPTKVSITEVESQEAAV
jgi:DNA adenine methylase